MKELFKKSVEGTDPVEPEVNEAKAAMAEDTAVVDNGTTEITFAIDASFAASSASFELNIERPWVSDLVITLTNPNGDSVTLHDRTGNRARRIKKTYKNQLKDLLGSDVEGTWTLKIVDEMTQYKDQGTVKAAVLTVKK